MYQGRPTAAAGSVRITDRAPPRPAAGAALAGPERRLVSLKPRRTRRAMGTRAVVATANVKTRILARAAADRCHSSEGAIAGWIEGLLATPQSSSHAPMGTRVVGRARRRLSGGIAARICSKCQGFEGSSPTGYLAAPPNGPALSAPLVRMEGNRPRRSRTPGRRGNSRYFL